MSFRLVVLASGTGTNLRAIIDELHLEEGEEGVGPAIEVAGVASDKPEAGALVRAGEAGIGTAAFPIADHGDRERRDAAIADWIEARGADLVVLAGYMQLLSPSFVDRFRARIVNVHPALLPSFPGLDAIGQALEHGVRITGVTVHFVDEGVDSGPIIVQRPVPVPPDRDRDTLEDAIHRTEHALYPQTIRMIAQGRVRIDPHEPRVVIVDD
jgi:phosphoribosylglycinamide formyltransferase-1